MGALARVVSRHRTGGRGSPVPSASAPTKLVERCFEVRDHGEVLRATSVEQNLSRAEEV